MALTGKGYLNLGLDNIVNIILAIIPFTSWILGSITRVLRGHLIAGLLQLIIPPITLFYWVIDIITNVKTGDISYWA